MRMVKMAVKFESGVIEIAGGLAEEHTEIERAPEP
jgi:hypothetical protein